MTKVFTEQANQAWSHRLPGKMTTACMAIRAGGKVLMVKAGYKDHWTFPSGVVDESESPQITAIRETIEEVGLTVAEKDCRFLAVVYTAGDTEDRDRCNFAFVTDAFSEDAELLVPNDEIEEAQWVVFEEVAKRSGNRSSYVNLQRLLLNPDAPEAYIEVRANR